MSDQVENQDPADIPETQRPYAQHIFVPPGLEKTFALYLDEIFRWCEPTGPIEKRLFQDFLRSDWTMKRIEIGQAELGATGIDPILSDDPRAIRLESTYNRYRAHRNSTLKRLCDLQSSRMADEFCPLPIPGLSRPALAKSSDIFKLAGRTHPTSVDIAEAKAELKRFQARLPGDLRPKVPLRHTDFLSEEERIRLEDQKHRQ